MKCINRFAACFVISASLLMCGCSSSKYQLPYTADSKISSFRIVESTASAERTEAFAANLCVTDKDVSNPAINLSSKTVGGGLFDIRGKEVIFAQNVNERFNPASLTKIMTAIVALKNGSADMILTATSNIKNLESGAKKIDNLEPGDSMTLAQALNLLLIDSANDVAIMIAEGIGGSQEAFCEMMNAEAKRIGATNSHFMNPHGLTADDHYTTPYDLYLMMNEATKFELFNEIIHSTDYSTVFYDSQGSSKEVSVKSTNYYIIGNAEVPTGVTVVGGKTGTTNAAGHCLVLLSRDTKSNPYISVILKSENREQLYSNMSVLLKQIR